MCKNSRARFDGGCIPQRSCAAKPGFKVVGKGKFGLRCSPAAAPTTTSAPYVCTDIPGWASSRGHTCADHELGTPSSRFEPLCAARERSLNPINQAGGRG